MTVRGSSFSRMATVVASTKRMASMQAGSAGSSGVHLSQLMVYPISPMSTAMSARMDITLLTPVLDEPYEVMQTFAEGSPDVRKGDVLVVAGKDYPISFVEDWSFRNDRRIRIILEQPDRR